MSVLYMLAAMAASATAVAWLHAGLRERDEAPRTLVRVYDSSGFRQGARIWLGGADLVVSHVAPRILIVRPTVWIDRLSPRWWRS